MSSQSLHIFKAGKHSPMQGGSLEFSSSCVQAIADNYDPALFSAPLVVGHPKTDDPAYGWVSGLSCEDGNLRATHEQMSPAFAASIEAGHYKKISSAFFTPDHPSNPTPGEYYLRHVGFLGAAAPAIPGLDPVTFAANDAPEKIVTVEFAVDGWDLADMGRMLLALKNFLKNKFKPEEVEDALGGWSSPENLIERGAYEAGKEAGKDLGAEETPAPVSAFSSTPSPGTPSLTLLSPKQDESPMSPNNNSADQSDLPASDLQAREDALARREAEFAAQQSRHKADAFVSDLVSQGKVLPAESERIASFMASLDDEQTVSFAVGDGGDGKTEQKSQSVLFAEILEGLPKRVDFSEQTAGAPVDGADSGSMEDILEKAEAYQAEFAAKGKTVDIATAVAQVTSGRA